MTQSKRIVSFVTIAAALVLLPGRMAAQSGSFPVGHATRILNVPGIHKEPRPVTVHLWYPAPDPQNCQSGDGNSQGCPPSVYTSRLNGIPLLPQWDPLSWTIGSSQSFEELPVSSAQNSYPVIIFSPGNQRNAIDYAYMLEGLASFGYIVAAPDHVNDTQDDVRIDFINSQARIATGNPNLTLIPCLDGLASPCAHASIAESMTDRVHDVSAIIGALSNWFGDRADKSRIGVMGHSRGTITALVAAGGSTLWGLDPVPGVKAIMGLAIGGTLSVSLGANLQNVTVPALLVAGELDMASPYAFSLDAFNILGTPVNEKQFVLIPNAKHRHFVSGVCAQTQSSGVIAEANPTRAILDLQTISSFVTFPSPPGVAMDLCGPDTFFDPVNNPPTYDIRRLVFQLTGFNVTSNPVNVPTTGLTSDAVKDQVVQLAVGFFRTRLEAQ